MMTSSFKRALRQGFLVALSTISIVGVGYVFASPTAAPPGSSIALPLTRGATAETKTGALTLSGGLTVSGGSGLCLGGVCKTAWPSATVQAGNATTTPVNANIAIPSYTSNGATSTNTYYYTYYGSLYTQNVNTYWYNQSFTITMAVPSGGIPITITSQPTVYCYFTNSGYSYSPAYYSSGYSNNYSIATNVSGYINASNQVVLTGTCPVYLQNGYYNTNYVVAAPSAGVGVRYLY